MFAVVVIYLYRCRSILHDNFDGIMDCVLKLTIPSGIVIYYFMVIS